MLFFLHESLIEELDKDNNIAILEQLALSRRKGNHIVTGSRKTLQKLSQCENLSKVAQGIYGKLYNKLTTVANTLNRLPTRVEIISGDIFETLHQNNIQIIKVSTQYLIDLNFNKTTFLAENLNDIKFYETLAQVYINQNRLGLIPIKFNPIGGGGQTTAQQLEVILKRKEELCLSILDSDRKSPHCTIGCTAKALENTYKKYADKQSMSYSKYANYFCKIEILNVREIENLIPSLMYPEILNKRPERSKAVSSIQQLTQSSVSEAMKYIDIKRGTTLANILKDRHKTDFFKFWSNICNNYQYLNNECLDNQKCFKANNKECNCIITHPFGDNILEMIMDLCLSKTSPKRIYEEIDHELKSEWEKIGEIITSWCCGSSRISG